MNLLNSVTHLMAYADSSGQTDNPRQRVFDWNRQISGIEVVNPASDHKVIPVGGSFTLFDGSTSVTLDATSVLSLTLVPGAAGSVYRLSVTSGPAGFRTARVPTGIVACTVTINNNAIAVFNFTGATLTGIVPGDIMRINGQVGGDTAPYAFSSENSGRWRVLAVSGTQISCTRLPCEPFSAMVETVAIATNDVQFYSADGVQTEDKMDIAGSFSPASWGRFVIQAVTATTIDFMSANPLPLESGIAYVVGTISFFTQSKRLIYIEADQESSVQLDGDTGLKVRISPISPGSPTLVGYFHKWGDTFKCVVVNRSVNPMNIKWISGE